MQKWEYLIVVEQYKAPLGGNIASDLPGTYIVGRVNDQVVSSQNILMSEYINKIGEEGWELFDIRSTSYWVFKRPKPDQDS